MIKTQIYKHNEILPQDRKKAVNVLFVGECAVGKSTIINGVLNHALNIKCEDPVRYKYEYLEYDLPTLEIREYLIRLKDDKNLIITDTPGFSDKRNYKENSANQQKISEYIKNHYNDIDYVGFVVKSQESRLTAYESMIFKDILKILNSYLKKKELLLLITHSDKSSPVLAAIQEAGIKYSNFFNFNNSSLYPPNEECDIDESPYDPNDPFVKAFWNLNNNGINKFISYVMHPKDRARNSNPPDLSEFKKLVDTLIKLIADYNSWNETKGKYDMSIKNYTVTKCFTQNINLNCKECQKTCHRNYYKTSNTISCSSCNCPMKDHDKQAYEYIDSKGWLEPLKSQRLKTQQTISSIQSRYDKELENLKKGLILVCEKQVAKFNELIDFEKHAIIVQMIDLFYAEAKQTNKENLKNLGILVDDLKKELFLRPEDPTSLEIKSINPSKKSFDGEVLKPRNFETKDKIQNKEPDQNNRARTMERGSNVVLRGRSTNPLRF